MKMDRITKMYENLTGKEKALLSFHYSVMGNTTEADRIAAMVPWKTYKMRDAEFLAWLHAVHHVAEFWGWQHWKMQAKRLAALGGMQIMLAREDYDRLEAFTEAFELWEACLLALDVATETVCTQHGIDPNTIRALYDAERFRPLSTGIAPDAEYLTAVEGRLAEILEALERRRWD